MMALLLQTLQIGTESERVILLLTISTQLAKGYIKKKERYNTVNKIKMIRCSITKENLLNFMVPLCTESAVPYLHLVFIAII